ncbi:MAG TPA: BTAD domain-containing putative transcriptional regulator [Acidimicrobiia bacterium]|nr:BTAD domain-containing putative transcriptional regulator [Acidimicrobiia bacterium]
MSAAPSRLSIQLLGSVSVTVDDAPLRVDTKKAVALLAYLASNPEGQVRERLCDLLWPESTPQRARATLRRTLSALRSALGDRWVEADRTFVWLERSEAVTIDVADFEGEQRRARQQEEAGRSPIQHLTRAAGLYRGPFLHGFGLRDSPEFDDWMMSESERLDRLAATTLRNLTKALTAVGRHDEASETARRWIQLDPLSEDAHRRLMLLHAWSGDRSAAVETYRSCVEMLDRELGVDPLEETTELYEAILESDLPPAPTAPKAPSPTDTPRPVPGFVGRQHVIEAVRAVVERGHGLIVVDGEVGVGKTRLLEELHPTMSEPDETMITAWAHRMESGVAYGPIQAALRQALSASGAGIAVGALPESVRGQAARLVPGFGTPATDDPTDPTAKGRFLDGLARTIGSIAPTTVLAIDNLHWSDDATLEFLSHLSRRLDELGVVLVLTRRPEDTPADHPVTMLVEDLAAIATTLRLERLSRDDVASLVEQAAVPELDAATVFERTRGLPFFIVEYLAAAREGRTDLPVAIRRLLLGRLSELDSIGRQIVTALSVIGTSSDFGTIRAVSGRSEEEVLASLDDLIRRGIVRETGTDLDFTHDQLREVGYAEATLARRRLLHRRVAEHLVRVPDAVRDPVAIAAAARHRLEAGDEDEAAALSLAAGDLAASVFADADALGHYETALALRPDSATPHLRIGEIRTRMGEYSQALVSLEMARSRLARDGRPEEAASAAHAIGEIYRRLGRWELAIGAYREAMGEEVPDDLRATVAASWAYVLHRAGNAAEARATAERARAFAEQSGDPSAMAHAFNLSGMLETSTELRRTHLERALELAGDERTRVAILNNLALAAAQAGDLAAALEYGTAALDQASIVGDVHRLAALHDNLADFHHRLGNEEAAMAELKEAVTLFAKVDAEPGERVPEIWLLKEW